MVGFGQTIYTSDGSFSHVGTGGEEVMKKHGVLNGQNVGNDHTTDKKVISMQTHEKVVTAAVPHDKKEWQARADTGLCPSIESAESVNATKMAEVATASAEHAGSDGKVSTTTSNHWVKHEKQPDGTTKYRGHFKMLVCQPGPSEKGENRDEIWDRIERVKQRLLELNNVHEEMLRFYLHEDTRATARQDMIKKHLERTDAAVKTVHGHDKESTRSHTEVKHEPDVEGANSKDGKTILSSTIKTTHQVASKP